tara:strand:- start:224 stop:487 length:264 start_codon:yes stop_codon:yes gene_type:complete
MDEGWWESGKLIRAAPETAKFRWMGVFSLLVIVTILFVSQLISEKEDKLFFIFCCGIIPFNLLLISLPTGFGISLGGPSEGGGGGGG